MKGIHVVWAGLLALAATPAVWAQGAAPSDAQIASMKSRCSYSTGNSRRMASCTTLLPACPRPRGFPKPTATPY